MEHTPTPWKVVTGQETLSIQSNDENEIYLEFPTIDYLATERNPNIYMAMDRAMKIRREAIRRAEGGV